MKPPRKGTKKAVKPTKQAPEDYDWEDEEEDEDYDWDERDN